MNQKSEKEEKEGSDSPIGARLEEIAKSGGVTAKSDGEAIHCLSIIGQIEGHYVLDQTQKTTKYEHLIPLLCAVEESREIDGLLLILNTMGGDVVVRVNPNFALAMHIDTDEANAACAFGTFYGEIVK